MRMGRGRLCLRLRGWSDFPETGALPLRDRIQGLDTNKEILVFEAMETESIE